MYLRLFKRKSNIFFIIFIVSLIVIYGTPYGIPGVNKCYAGFVLPDMQFGYTYDNIKNLFNNLGSDGLKHYLYFYKIDFIFIISIAGVQFNLLDRFKFSKSFIDILCIIFIVLRCILDFAEDIIFVLMIKGIHQLSEGLINSASIITEIKLIAFALWAVIFIIKIVSEKRSVKS